MNRKLMGLAIVGFVFTSGCQHIEQHLGTNSNSNSGATQTKIDEFAAPRGVYEKECKSCHGDTGSGGPIKLKDGTTLKVPSLREGHALRHPDSDFVKQINKGGDGMPAFGEKLKSDQINDLVRFIRHEFEGGITPPAEPAKSPMKDMKK